MTERALAAGDVCQPTVATRDSGPAMQFNQRPVPYKRLSGPLSTGYCPPRYRASICYQLTVVRVIHSYIKAGSETLFRPVAFRGAG